MHNHETILGVVERVCALTKEFVFLHFSIEKSQNGFINLIKSIFGAPAPTELMLKQSKVIHAKLVATQAMIKVTHESNRKYFSSEEHALMNAAMHLIDSDIKAAKLLVKRQDVLFEKSKGKQGRPLTLKEFAEINHEYSQALNLRQSAFESLQFEHFVFIDRSVKNNHSKN